MISDSIVDVNAALDDIISKRRVGKRAAPRIDEPLPLGRGGGRRNQRRRNSGGGGGFGNAGFGNSGFGNQSFGSNSGSFGNSGFGNSGFGNSGFGNVGPRRQFGGGGGRRTNNTSGEDVVWINISNLPDTVLTGDLQELFQEFNLLGVGVHYDEFGQHMGTADLFVDGRSAKAILREYANIAIDGQKIRFAIVNEQAAATPQFQNQQRRDNLRGVRRHLFGWVLWVFKWNIGEIFRAASGSRSPIGRAAGGGVSKPRRVGRNTTNQVKTAAELDRELEAYMNGMKISSDEEGEYGDERRSQWIGDDGKELDSFSKKVEDKSTKSNEESPQKPTFTTSQIWDEQELHDDEEGENEQVMEDESLNGISTSPFWTQSIAPGKYYNRARGGGQTATAALLSLQRQFENCIIQTIRDGMATQPKCDPPPPTNSNNCSSHNCDAANNNCSKHVAGSDSDSDNGGDNSDNSSSSSISSHNTSKNVRNNSGGGNSNNSSPLKKRFGRRRRKRQQIRSFAREEILRKRSHPAALHPDIGFNEPGQLNDGPLCKCSWAAKQTGVRHGKFAGEKAFPRCDWNSSLTNELFRSPNPASLSRHPTQIQIDGHCYKFDGFSVFFHKPLPERFPQRPINQWTQHFQVRFLHENAPESFTVADLELFHSFLFEQILELYDLNRQLNIPKEEMNSSCPFYHCLPRFARSLPDNGKELLPLSSILSHFITNFTPLVDDRLAQYFHINPLALVDFACQKKGEICINPKKKPLAVRLDLLEKSADNKEFYPIITHFGIKPNAYAFLARPQMQDALYKHLQLRKHLSSKSSITFEEKWLLRKSEAHLNALKRECKSKRNTIVHISSRDFYSTGICSDMVLHSILLVLACQHNRSLLELALIHPSFRANYGTNSDHAKNVLNNCEENSLELLTKQQLIQKTGRRRGINVLMEIMSMQRSSSSGNNKIKENNGGVGDGGRIVNRINESIIKHNERLEFLGDAVVEFLTTIHLFFLFTELDEGGLATFRSALVQNRHLATLGDRLGLQHFMVYAHGPDLCHSADLRHAMANTFEALMAAVFLDSGLEQCDKIFANALFVNESNLLQIWTNLPEHPLKKDTPYGDRHLISSVPCLKLLVEFERCIGITFKHIRLLAKAFTRRNVPYNFLTLGHNQRLEFLGDTILQLLTSEYLYKQFPYHQEGHLSLLRTCLVQATTQAVVCDDLTMVKYLVIPQALLRKCPQPNLRTKDKADLYFILSQRWNDPKSQLQQSCLTLRNFASSEPDIPEYKTIGIEGPTNTRIYRVAVYFRNKRLAVGTGASMHLAQMKAAENALIENSNLFKSNGYINENNNKNIFENKSSCGGGDGNQIENYITSLNKVNLKK
uniref:Uncharacterized protein n=1 Tax=Meloidogyne javanica TaxID=6303 RepID=A0A915N1G1_MELJA